MTANKIIRGIITAQATRIVERGKLTNSISANMKIAVQNMLGDLLAIQTQRQLACKLHRSPEAVSRLKNGTLDCSHELFLELFQLWAKLPKEPK